MHNWCIGSVYQQMTLQHGHHPILELSVNIASTIFSFASWIIYVLIDCRHPFIRYWQPVLAKTTATCSLPHPENKHQRRVLGYSCWIVDDQTIVLIIAFIIEGLTALIGKHTIDQRYNTDSTLIDIASCKTCKNISLVDENSILIRYYSHIPKRRALIESMDGPAGQPAHNLPNSNQLRVYHRSVLDSMVWVFWQPGTPIWQCFGLDLDPDRKWRSGTIANTKWGAVSICPVCLPVVVKVSSSEHWPLHFVSTLLMDEMLDAARYKPHRGKLRCLCRGWYA